MEFEQTYKTTFSKMEIVELIAALNSHIRRLKRDLRHRERQGEEAAINGDTATVEAIAEHLPARRARIQRAMNLKLYLEYQIKEYIKD